MSTNKEKIQSEEMQWTWYKPYHLDSTTEWFKYEEGANFFSPINTDHVMFIWGGKPVLSCSKKLSRYQIAKYFGA